MKEGCFIYLLTLSLISRSMSLSPPEGKYKVLMLLPFSSQSHRNCFLPLAEALADRGHKVVILSALPPKSKHPNVREINHGIEVLPQNMNMFEVRENDPTKGFNVFETILPKLARELYNKPEVRELYEKRKQFDIIIIDELFNEPAYPFVEGLNYATIATAGVTPMSSAVLGNVLNPSYISALTIDYPRPYSFVQRAKNFVSHVLLPYYWRHSTMFPLIEKELLERFPDLPPLSEIEKGQSVALVNSHFSLDIPMPVLPSQVEVGGMHCRPGKKLPKALQSFIDSSGTPGVIYFSLGSVCEGKSIPEKYKAILLEAFSKLNQRIIWKFEEEITDLPENVLVQSWLPQQDILAHPKVKLFITHGGLLSMQEAVYHATPLLALPIFGDQERNAQRIYNKGFGKFLTWEDLTVDSLISAIEELINDPKYSNKLQSVSTLFRDQPMTPLEKAIWWTEYFVRHKGAPQLKSPGSDLSWMEYLMADVISVAFVVIIVLYWLAKNIIVYLFSALFNIAFKPKVSPKKKRS